MKKLNRKGFTLIELLAVIVIMAIILIVTVPNIIQSINDARTNSIHNLAVSVANTYNTAYGQDLVATDKVLGNIPEKVNSTWQCIGDIYSDNNGTKVRDLSDVLGLSNADLVLTVEADAEGNKKIANETNLGASNYTDYCSSIRIYNGGAEVILIAKQGGRFYVAQETTYAYSEASSANAKK